MRTRSRRRRGTIIASAITAIAVAVTAAVGLGWPPAEASASLVPQGAEVLGLSDATAVDLGPAVTSEMKFDEVVAQSLASATATLTVPALKTRIPVAKTPAPKKVAPKPAAKKKAKKKVKPKTRWKRARASWYGPGLYGSGLAGGGRLKRRSMVVAHRTLKFGTRIQFRYKGRTVIGVVKDRGPFIRGRVFDLGPGVAKRLHFDGVGTVKYRIIR